MTRIWSSNDIFAPPPYSWDQSGKVAEKTIDLLKKVIEKWTDGVGELEVHLDLEELRTLQGVGIVLAGLLHQFETEGGEGTAQSKAFYFLEDF